MSLTTPSSEAVAPATGALRDRFGRVHDYLRISVTDRCNYRCVYCLPAEGATFLPHGDVLTFEEIVRIVRVFVRCGVRRVRLTGGEPTVRRDLVALVRMLGELGLDDLAMTTNGHRFAPLAKPLAAAGLRRVNVSIDSLDPARFRAMTRGGDLARVLEAIDAARDAGLTPVKLNVVVMAGENDHEIDTIVDFFAPHAADTQVRFIEYMAFSAVDEAKRHHLPASQIRARLAARGLAPIAAAGPGGGPATHARLADSGLVVGFISPITEHFCASCNRLRLQADGHLRTCLSREADESLRDVIRRGVDDEALEATIRARLWRKVAGHEAHLDDPTAFEGYMTTIGG